MSGWLGYDIHRVIRVIYIHAKSQDPSPAPPNFLPPTPRCDIHRVIRGERVRANLGCDKI